jgi:hypothetical protein
MAPVFVCIQSAIRPWIMCANARRHDNSSDPDINNDRMHHFHDTWYIVISLFGDSRTHESPAVMCLHCSVL